MSGPSHRDFGKPLPKKDVPTPGSDITYFWIILDLVWQGKIGLLQEPLDKKHYSCSRLEIGRSNVATNWKKTSRGSDAYVSPSEAAKSTGLGAREETWNNKEHKLGNIMDHHATCLFKVAVVPTRCQVQYIYIYLYFAMFLKNKNIYVLKQIWYFPYFRLAFVFHFVDSGRVGA